MTSNVTVIAYKDDACSSDTRFLVHNIPNGTCMTLQAASDDLDLPVQPSLLVSCDSLRHSSDWSAKVYYSSDCTGVAVKRHEAVSSGSCKCMGS